MVERNKPMGANKTFFSRLHPILFILVWDRFQLYADLIGLFKRRQLAKLEFIMLNSI